jgi:MAF protein
MIVHHLPAADPRLPTPALVLASASPRRRELLTALGLPFDVVEAGVDETVHAGETPEDAALRLARQKAWEVARRYRTTHARPGPQPPLVLGADTVVVLDSRVLGKPADAAEAGAMLRALRGRTHTVITGVAAVDPLTTGACTVAPQTAVTMRDYTDAEIAASIAAGTPFDKAGAYAIQDDVLAPAASIDGCYCNVVGLPLWTVRRLILKLRPRLRLASPHAARPVCATCPLARSREEGVGSRE